MDDKQNHQDSTVRLSELVRCFKCGGDVKTGIALQNTPTFGVPDFPNQTDLRGQTFTMDGPPKLIECLKCCHCGHSFKNPHLEAARKALRNKSDKIIGT